MFDYLAEEIIENTFKFLIVIELVMFKKINNINIDGKNTLVSTWK